MEILKAVYERRSVRDFADAEVRRGVVKELVQAANQAPSAHNEQPWAFSVFHGRRRLMHYSDRAKEYLLRAEDPSYGLDPHIDEFDNQKINIFHGADTLIVISATPGRFSPTEDCFLAAQNLMLAAHGMGLGSCLIGSVRSWLNLPEVKSELGIPANHIPTAAIVVGIPDAGLQKHAQAGTRNQLLAVGRIALPRDDRRFQIERSATLQAHYPNPASEGKRHVEVC